MCCTYTLFGYYSKVFVSQLEVLLVLWPYTEGNINFACKREEIFACIKKTY